MVARSGRLAALSRGPVVSTPCRRLCLVNGAPAEDGALIPVTLLRRRDTPTDGSAPVLLYGYGAYGITLPADFRTARLSLVDRGFIWATADVRGSMAKGYQWYLDGKLDKKTNKQTNTTSEEPNEDLKLWRRMYKNDECLGPKVAQGGSN